MVQRQQRNLHASAQGYLVYTGKPRRKVHGTYNCSYAAFFLYLSAKNKNMWKIEWNLIVSGNNPTAGFHRFP